jgi:hypothetical protein
VVVGHQYEGAVTKRPRGEGLVDCDYAAVKDTLPRLSGTDSRLACKTKVLEAAECICLSVFARDSLIYPTCVTKGRIVLLWSGV